MLKINMLQTPGIELNGAPVILPFKRAEALLYYMAVKRTASRQELIALLWESEDEAKGLKNLRNALYTLKKTLGGDVLVSPQKAMISLNPAWEIQCDYDRFVRDGDFSAYQAPFLSGFAIRNAFALDEWIFRTREKLHGMYLRGLEAQAKDARLSQNYDEAIRFSQLYLSEEPYDETMAAFLMRCLKETENFARATQVYQRLKELLSKEMGVDPLESTTMLYYEILNQWNNTAKQVEEPDGSAAPVGREQAYDALRAAANTFMESSSRRCSQLLVGETGSGKSELINHFLRSGNVSALLTVRCECMQSDSQQPLTLWSRIMRPILEFSRREGIQLPAQALERIGNTISLYDGSVPERMPYDQALEDSVMLVFSLVSRKKKLLLILDDLQWADAQSLQLLNTLLRHLERGALMAILSTTWGYSDWVQTALHELEADGLLHQQVLDPLSRADTEAFLRRELGVENAVQLAEKFYQESGGNLKLLITLAQAYRNHPDTETSSRAMGRMLLKRLGNLSTCAVQVTEKLCLFHHGLSSSLLLDLMDGREQQLSEALLELRRRTILEEFQFNEQTCYRFVHSRLRDLVYDRLTVYQRKELHSQVAARLAGDGEVMDEITCREVSHHYQRADKPQDALRYRILALDKETARCCEPFYPERMKEVRQVLPSDLETEAADCMEVLFSLRKPGVPSHFLEEMELRLTMIRGRLAIYRGDMQQGYALLGELTGISAPRDPRQMARACELLASAAYYQQATELAEHYVSTGLHFLARSPDPVQQARLYRLRGCCFGLRGDYDRAGYYLQEAVEILEKQLPSPQVRGVLAAAYGDLGRGARCRNDFVHAGRWFKKAELLQKDTECAGQVWIYVHYGRTVFAVDDQLRARELFSDALKIARERDELWGRTAAAAYCAYFQMTDGDHNLAAQTLQEAMACAEQIQSPLESGILNFVCMRIRRRLDLEQRLDSPLQPLLSDSADDYARRGVRLCSGIPDVFEMQMLSKDLRDGISSQLRYRSSELYSKNKRFMSE